jgi:mono/diheme cytochrome c family protein
VHEDEFMKTRNRCTFIALLLVAGAAAAEVPADYLRSLEAAARAASTEFPGFSATRGAAWFSSRHGTDWSCATCHTDNPLSSGRHATTGRSIAPMAPAANPERLTDTAKIEKWFRRNCNDVLGRTCTPAEKGDVIAYLTSLKR